MYSTWVSISTNALSCAKVTCDSSFVPPTHSVGEHEVLLEVLWWPDHSDQQGSQGQSQHMREHHVDCQGPEVQGLHHTHTLIGR